jgi:nucleotide-binding universal stress UspA family protein
MAPQVLHRARRVLIAYDGSSSARRALDHAAELHCGADDFGVVSVAEDPARADAHAREACRLLADRGIEATPIAAVGVPAQTICVTAERLGYDTIVVGRRNAGLMLPGSVSQRVVAGAAGTVLVVA